MIFAVTAAALGGAAARSSEPDLAPGHVPTPQAGLSVR